MKVAVGCDHGGYALKRVVLDCLDEDGIEYIDLGCHENEKVDYPDYAQKVADKVLSGEADYGILLCGTGIGISIAANKIPGIRCALLSDCYSAELTRRHNDANVMAMGGRVVGPGLAKKITRTFLGTRFSNGDKHIRRIRKFQSDYKYKELS